MLTATRPFEAKPRYLGHRWGDQTPPRLPTLLREVPLPTQHFADLKALARKVASLRQGRPLILRAAAEQMPDRSFAVTNILAEEIDGSETWIGAAWTGSTDPQALARGLEAVDPQGSCDGSVASGLGKRQTRRLGRAA